MNKTVVFSYPKINLALDIFGKDTSGYHRIQTVFHELRGPEYSHIHDEIVIEPHPWGGIEVSSDNPLLPADMTNTVMKAAVMLQKYSAVQMGASIFIRKKIPLMSGLGGGAGNAVAVLKALARLWNVPCCQGGHADKHCLLQKIARQIGMDCAFFFHGGTALGEHFGEKITPLPPLPKNLRFEIIPTGVGISSRLAYENADLSLCGKNRKKTKFLTAAIFAGDAAGIIKNIHNDFEASVFRDHPALLKRKKNFDRPTIIFLAGSGGALVKAFINTPAVLSSPAPE